MPIVALCPKCEKSFALPDDARGDYGLCPECGHLLAVSLGPTSAIAPGAPVASEVRGDETGIQSEILHFALSHTERGAAPTSDIERGLGSILALLGVRFSSPLAWLGALVLFFLPWVEIRCFDKQGKLTHHTTHSGAQLAWGGAADVMPKREVEKQAEQREDDFIRPGAIQIAPDAIKTSWNEVASNLVMSIYFMLLAIGLVLKVICFMLDPSRLRSGVGAVLALAVLLMPLFGMWLQWGNPLYLPSEPGVIAEYTSWYYASYVINLLALFSFGMECWLARNQVRRRPT